MAVDNEGTKETTMTTCEFCESTVDRDDYGVVTIQRCGVSTVASSRAGRLPPIIERFAHEGCYLDAIENARRG